MGGTPDTATDATRAPTPSTRNPGANDQNGVPSTRNPGTDQNAVPSVRNPGSADQTKDVDNTKVNRRDTPDSLTPMDQGNSSAETKITAAVRRAIMAQDLSFTAKNVKVITNGGKVTLRGPVKTEQERAAIEAAAQKTAGVHSVDNQLEVKQ